MMTFQLQLRLLIAFPLVFTFSCLTGGAQDVTNGTNTGYPEHAIFHGTEIEKVQLNNGDLHVQIPIYSAKGRHGLDTAGNYIYDNKEWYLSNHCYSSGICVDTVTAELNSNMVLTAHGPMDYVISYKTASFECTPTLYSYGTSNVVLREPNGTKHHFIADPASTTPQTCGGITTTSTLYADDGSGWMITLDANSKPTAAVDKHGTSMGVEDSNGNQLVRTSTTTGTDTLGRTFYDGSSYTYSSSSAQYVDSSNTLRSFAVTSTTSVTVATQECPFSEADQCTEHNDTWTVPSVITLPNNQTYSFTYAQNQGAEITSITLPTGGQISYTYGVWQPGGRRVATRRVLSSGVSGTWTYTVNGTSTTTLTDPYGNDTVSDCNGSYTGGGGPCFSHFTKYYSGSSVSGGTLLKTLTRDYENLTYGLGSSVNIMVLPIRHTTTWNQTNQVSKTETDWDTKTTSVGTAAWSNPLETREYDYGSGSPGALIRRTHYNYLHLQNSTYLYANIADRITSKIVYDGSGNTVAQMTLAYDGVAVTATSGVPGHDYTHYSASNNVRGNLTSTSVWRNIDGAWLTSNSTYDDLGNRLSVTDPLSHTTQFSFTDSTIGACPPGPNTHAYPTQVTDALGFRTQNAYFYCNGLPASTKDENDIRAGRAGTQYLSYDSLNRILQISYPDGGNTTYSYGGSVPTTITKTDTINSSTSKTTVTELDGMGRERKNTLTTDPDGMTYARTSYDSAGRVSQEWNPTRCDPDLYSSCPGETTFGYKTHQYDALNRETLLIPQDGTASVDNVKNTYLGSATTTIDEAGVSRTVTKDALGRITKVSEDNPGWITQYTYDVLNDLTCVEQHGNASGTGCSSNPSSDSTSPWRIRRFTYDSIGHLLAAKNPETGVLNSNCNGSTNPWSICYTYNNDGVLTSKTDARGVIVNYSPSGSPIDALHRITQKTFSNGDATISYSYDNTSVNGIHHRTGMTDGSGSTSWSYDNEGRLSSESRTISGIHESTNTQYNWDGSMWKVTYPDNTIMEYTVGGAGRATALNDDTHSTLYAKSVTYAPQGTIKSAILGYTSSFAGINLSEQYNTRLQPSAITAAVGAATKMSLSYNFGIGTNNNGNLYGITNGKDSTRNETFTYDSANRILTAKGGTAWGIYFWNSGTNSPGIDPWGNLVQTSALSGTSTLAMSVNQGAATMSNQFALNGFSYDSSGNVLNDGISTGCGTNGSASYSWNAEELMTCAAGSTYVYDGDGRRVKKSGGTATPTLYWMGTEDTALAESDLSGNISAEYIFLGSRRLARRNTSGAIDFYLSDILGSSTVVTDATGTIQNESDFYPFGGERVVTQNLIDHYKFSGEERDTESGDDYFGARYARNIVGRFMSPDWSDTQEPVPYAKLDDPQSLNLYSFVGNNPESIIDLDGHAFEDAYNVESKGPGCSYNESCEQLAERNEQGSASSNPFQYQFGQSDGKTFGVEIPSGVFHWLKKLFETGKEGDEDYSDEQDLRSWWRVYDTAATARARDTNPNFHGPQGDPEVDQATMDWAEANITVDLVKMGVSIEGHSSCPMCGKIGEAGLPILKKQAENARQRMYRKIREMNARLESQEQSKWQLPRD
ncbi:MAG TPA: RHS repeat-associated core domain-containing protein [Terracidiphilus sp.]|jgi:RHS repeat-associated protein